MYKYITVRPAQSWVMSWLWLSILSLADCLAEWVVGQLDCCLSVSLAVCLLDYLFGSLIACVYAWQMRVLIWSGSYEKAAMSLSLLWPWTELDWLANCQGYCLGVWMSKVQHKTWYSQKENKLFYCQRLPQSLVPFYFLLQMSKVTGFTSSSRFIFACQTTGFISGSRPLLLLLLQQCTI